VQDPERYLKAQAIEVPCPVRPARHARLVPRYRADINYEIYFFSTDDARERFRNDPLRYCGWLTDPVSRARFRPTAASPRIKYKGRPYYFMSDSSRVTFQAAPDSFALRRGM